MSEKSPPKRTARPPRNMADRYDFTRPDRIPQSQTRALQLVCENAVRTLSSNLTAHLGTYVVVQQAILEQTSYREFVHTLPSPSVVATVTLKPFDGFGVLDLTPELVFPFLETLLGRRSRFGPPIEREVTDIEVRLIESILRLILQDLREAWKALGPMEFKLQAVGKEPQFVHALSPSEAVLAVTIPVQIGDAHGRMHLALPSLAFGRMRQDAAPGWKPSASPPDPREQERVFQLIEMAEMQVDVQLAPMRMVMADLAALKPDDLLILDHPVHRPFRAAVNGKLAMTGEVIRAGRRLGFQVTDFVAASSAQVTGPFAAIGQSNG